ncbi:Cytochrome b-c1 complex subunit [Lachnellula occidentalis]|uniref:Cytochrome b-c1 complex subunit 8 n=1 Tax=Lachnellula occidentalis TaxID=215460 RepID=A0A8H8S7L4_9HELO|nr:Cytochrome b-c1 complex subunit [Lachnellula occidentalis]
MSFALSANRQRPLAGTLNAAIFNVWRRFSHQVLYVAPPMIIAYVAMGWAIEHNEYLNSKPGRLEHGEAE